MHGSNRKQTEVPEAVFRFVGLIAWITMIAGVVWLVQSV